MNIFMLFLLVDKLTNGNFVSAIDDKTKAIATLCCHKHIKRLEK